MDSESGLELNERVAVVTGGASGIGRSVAHRLSEHGAAGIVLADLNVTAAKGVAASVESSSRCRCFAVETDVSDESQVQSMVASAMKRFGRIDFLINNA